MQFLNLLAKMAKDLIEAYGYAMIPIIATGVARFVFAHAKSARVKLIAKFAYDAVSAQENTFKTNEEKKSSAVNDLAKTISNNFWGVNITPEELDMRIEGALQTLRAQQLKAPAVEIKPIEEQNKVINNVDNLANKESEK